MLPEEQSNTYKKYIVPETRLVEWNLFSKKAKVHFDKKEKPLLFVSGSQDRIIPSLLVKKNKRKYDNASSITEYKKVEGKSHLIIIENGWQETAAFIAEWIEKYEEGRAITKD